MNNTRTVHPSTNKWVMLTSAGIISAVAGLGVFASCDQQTLNSNTIPEISSLLNETITASDQPEDAKTEIQEEVKETKEASSKTVENSVPTPSIPEDATAQQQDHQTSKTEKDKYPVDANYLNSVNSWSMAVQYKDYVVLSPVGAEIWEEKAKKLKEMAEKDPYKWVNTYRYGYLYTHQINAQQVHKICSKALSYSETRSFWDMFFAPRSYFNFVWDICGREDKEKPDTWWYR